MNEDDRKKYLEELMQPHIPLRVLQEIRQEIIDTSYRDFNEHTWDYTDELLYLDDALEIIDRHIKEIEG